MHEFSALIHLFVCMCATVHIICAFFHVCLQSYVLGITCIRLHKANDMFLVLDLLEN